MSGLKWWHVALGAVALLALTGKQEREPDPPAGLEPDPPKPLTPGCGNVDPPDYDKYPTYGYAPGTYGYFLSQ